MQLDEGVSRCWRTNLWHGTNTKNGTAKFSEELAIAFPIPMGWMGWTTPLPACVGDTGTRFTPSSSMPQRCSLSSEAVGSRMVLVSGQRAVHGRGYSVVHGVASWAVPSFRVRAAAVLVENHAGLVCLHRLMHGMRMRKRQVTTSQSQVNSGQVTSSQPASVKKGGGTHPQSSL